MDDYHRDYIVNFFILHNVKREKAIKYIDSTDSMLLSHYSPWHIYCHYIDTKYNHTRTQAHQHILSWNNKDNVETSTQVGCYTCLNIYPSSEITEYYTHTDSDTERNSALCKHCKQDTIIPDSSYTINKDLSKDKTETFLLDLNKLWVSNDRGHDCLRCRQGIFPVINNM